MLGPRYFLGGQLQHRLDDLPPGRKRPDHTHLKEGDEMILILLWLLGLPLGLIIILFLLGIGH